MRLLGFQAVRIHVQETSLTSFRLKQSVSIVIDRWMGVRHRQSPGFATPSPMGKNIKISVDSVIPSISNQFDNRIR